MRVTGGAILCSALLAAACSQGSVPNGPHAGSTDSPQQIHAIPIGTGAPASNACNEGHGSSCHADERTDVPALPDSPSLQPPQIPGLHPADIQGAYALQSLAAGSGTTIAIVVAYSDPNAETDLAVYRAKFGLPPCTSAAGCLRFYDQHGTLGNRGHADAGWATETSIDLDLASAVCPRCTLDLVEASDDRPQNLAAALSAAVALQPAVVSNSWTVPEAAAEAYDATPIVHGNVAVVAGTGDSGAGVAWPASDPGVIAVSGTTLTRSSVLPRGWFEQAWTGAGYGCSTVVPRPAWQSPTLCGATRGVADIAAVGDPQTAVAIYDTFGPDRGHRGGSGGWELYGGTSVSTPIVAGAIGLASQNGVDMLTAASIYANAGALNPVTGGLSPLQGGLGSPNGTAAL